MMWLAGALWFVFGLACGVWLIPEALLRYLHKTARDAESTLTQALDSQQKAVAAYAKAEQMGREAAARHQEAINVWLSIDEATNGVAAPPQADADGDASDQT